MTTSITDARFTSLHFTSPHLVALSIDDDPESGWGVMPGYDQAVPVPLHLEPPRLDADETLPSLMHPSYPFGRGPTRGMVERSGGRGLGLLGALALGGGMGMGGGEAGGGTGAGAGGGGALDMGTGTGMGTYRGQWLGGRDAWREMGLAGMLERESKRELPPVMAGTKRPPSPPAPSLHPSLEPSPRSEHLAAHLARIAERSGGAGPAGSGSGGGAGDGGDAQGEDPFDAPVPNEAYEEVETGRGGPTYEYGQGAQAADEEREERRGVRGVAGR